ncbi:MAG: HPr family phosphocarrier protein [Lachnospiraceae bacterium]|nr:HPr family phosphocarrier protein [Lachnospiraceae bacterium]
MVSQVVKVVNPSGLHLKPAGTFCARAREYESTITFTFENTTANAKSVLSILSACVQAGSEIEIVCNGPDEKEALSALVGLVESGLEEGFV